MTVIHICRSCKKPFICIKPQIFGCSAKDQGREIDNKTLCNCQECHGGCLTKDFTDFPPRKGKFIGTRVYQNI